MTNHPIVLEPSPILRAMAAPVVNFDAELLTIAAEMFESMYAAHGVGLAAPQIGISKRIAVIDLTSGKDPDAKIVLVNPEIVREVGVQAASEGCLSLPGRYEIVSRPMWLTVCAQNLNGKAITVRGRGLLARAFAHEIDHLNGRLCLDDPK